MYPAQSLAPSRPEAGRGLLRFLLPLVLALVLIWSNSLSYLLFHTLAELFAVFVAVMMGVVAWHTYRFAENDFLMYLGCGYLAVGALDLLHTLSYPDLNVLSNSDVNAMASIWIASRYLEAFILLSSPWFLSRHLPRAFALAGFLAVAALLYGLVVTGLFPVAFEDASGLTAFKIYSEYLIIAMLAGAMLYLWRKRNYVQRSVLWTVLLSIVLTILAEFSFTQYASIIDLSLVSGHLLKFFSFWLIFTAIVQTSLKEPFQMLARGAHTYDAIPDPVLVVDQAGIIRETNSAASYQTHRAEHELLGQHCHVFFHDPEIASADCAICQAIHAGRSYTGLAQRRDEQRWLETSLSPISTRAGIEGMVHSVRDVTERMRAQHELAAHQEHLEGLVRERTGALESSRRTLANLLSNLPGAAYHYLNDPDWTAQLVSDGIRELTGYAPEDFTGKRISFGRQVIHPDDRESVWNQVQQGIERDGRFQVIYRIITAEGAEKWVWEQGLAVYDDSGRLEALEGFMTDISARKSAEDALQESSQRLAVVNQELESFNYSVSHDLRAPLRAIDGFSMLLLEDCNDRLDDTGRDYLRRVRNATQRMGQLIDDMLQLSRIGRGDLRKEPVDLSAMGRDAISLLQDSEPGREVQVSIQPDMQTRGDHGLLRVVIDNLLDNAWKYTRHRPQARIELSRQRHNGEDIYCVSDNGAGFDMAYVDKLFGAFQRLHHAEEYEGTGIGLATVRRIIGRHGGEVWAESEPDRGSRFYFSLPH